MQAASAQALIVRSDDSPVYREVVAELRRGLADAPDDRIEIAELHVSKATLEDVFIKIARDGEIIDETAKDKAS